MPRSDFEVCWYLSPVRIPDAELWAVALDPDRRQRGFGSRPRFGLCFWNPPVDLFALGGLLHEEVKESFKAFVVYQASLVLFPASIFRFKCFCLQYVFTYIIGITSTLAPYPSAPSLVAYMTQK